MLVGIRVIFTSRRLYVAVFPYSFTDEEQEVDAWWDDDSTPDLSSQAQHDNTNQNNNSITANTLSPRRILIIIIMTKWNFPSNNLCELHKFKLYFTESKFPATATLTL